MMKPLTPYLFFNGTCREAMQFYQKCIGGQLELMTYNEAPSSEMRGPGDHIMHSSLTNNAFMLMAADNPQSEPILGDHIHLSIHCETIEETQKIFKALSEQGKIVMPLADTFWGAHFGMCTDKYGIHWMLNCPHKSN